MRSDGKNLRLGRLWPVVPLLAVALWFCWRGLQLRSGLVVWSCGGNYESLRDLIREFERDEGVRVRYTAAPVTYLLGLALESSHPPDVLVGRGGPGWLALEEAGLLRGSPAFFAVDPLVIAVPRGNPGGVTCLEDLGRPGLRVSQSPGAMRPKGKVPALFMAAVSDRFHPGLVEAWETNAVATAECGRDLLAPLVQGRADVAIVPRSLLAYPGYRGRVDMIPIPPKYILAMKQGRPSMPQCAAVVNSGRGETRAALAARFVARLREDREWLGKHGYLPLDAPEAQPLKPLLKITAPRDMPGWQMALAEELEALDATPEARRRYLKVLYTFGPSQHDPGALFHAACISARLGQIREARDEWQWLLREFRPPSPVEYDSPVIRLTQKEAPVTVLDYPVVAERARELLREADTAVEAPAGAARRDPLLSSVFPVRVTDADAPKNGKRDFALGVHLMWVGDYEFATRDLLKVTTLHYPCRFAPQAEYLLGLCAEARGLASVASAQWARAARLYPDTVAGRLAGRKLDRLAGKAASPGSPGIGRTMPERGEAFTTHADRGMTYGMRLFEHRLPLYCFKEMMKVRYGVYGPHEFGSELTYRAGVACAAFGNESAACRLWSAAARADGNAAWATLAREALSHCAPQTPVEFRRTPELPPAKGGWIARFRLAEAFRTNGVMRDDQALLEFLKVCTVARPPETPAGRKVLALAELGVADCLLAAGKTAEACQRYDWVVKEYPDSPAAPPAREALGRLAPMAATPGGGSDSNGEATP